MITEEEVEQALHFISENAEAHARAKARVKGLEHRFKLAEARGFKDAAGSAEARKMEARLSTAYLALVEEHDGAWYDFQRLETDMEYARLVIDCWRTEQATLRASNFGA